MLSGLTPLLHVAEAGSLLESLMEGDFEAVLLSPTVLDLLSGDGCCSDGEGIEAYLERRVLLYLTGGSDNDHTNRYYMSVCNRGTATALVVFEFEFGLLKKTSGS